MGYLEVVEICGIGGLFVVWFLGFFVWFIVFGFLLGFLGFWIFEYDKKGWNEVKLKIVIVLKRILGWVKYRE